MSAGKCHERSLKQTVPLKLRKTTAEMMIEIIPLGVSEALEKKRRVP